MGVLSFDCCRIVSTAILSLLFGMVMVVAVIVVIDLVAFLFLRYRMKTVYTDEPTN